MKVLLISPLPPPVGGIATWTVCYENYCKEHQIPLSIINNALVGTRREKHSSKIRLLDEIFRTSKIINNLIRGVRKDKPDIIHLNSSCSRFGIFRDCLCTLIGRCFSVPVVLQCHCNIEDQIRGRLAMFAFRWMVSLSSKVFVLNRFSAEFAKRYSAEKVTIVPNFANESILFERINISKTIQRAVFVGHVRKEKGVLEILQAAEKFPNITFSLVGPVQQDIDKMPYSKNVEFLGAQSHDEVIKILREADIFLFPSYSEGFANALLEAMASGLPIIASDVGANAEMIEDKGGVIIPKTDCEALCAAIHYLDCNQLLRTQMSAWNTNKVLCKYLINVVMKDIFDIYEEIAV